MVAEAGFEAAPVFLEAVCQRHKALNRTPFYCLAATADLVGATVEVWGEVALQGLTLLAADARGGGDGVRLGGGHHTRLRGRTG